MISRFLEVNNPSESFKIGNKAKSLCELKSKGFNVPDGVVVDTDTYDDFIISNKIDNIIGEKLSVLNASNVSIISTEIQKLLETASFSKDTSDEILSFLSDEKQYAVRSSGTKEDLDNYSFAGQYKTFLNVKKDDVIDFIIKCYQSMFSEVILNYIVNNKIGTNGLKMAVIIQEMCDASLSGICFTCDPVSGNDKQMLIEVGEGLGENIVSGQNKPEQYYYNWFDETVSLNESNKLIEKNELLEYAEELFKVQEFYGYPCDIEFSIKDKKLFFLQSRRITKIKYKGYQYLWSTADFKDGGVSATICYPFMWSLYEYIWEYTLRKYLLDSKILNEKQIPNKLGEMFFARPYWNLSCVKLAMSQVVGYKEREFDSEFGVRINYEGDGKTTKASVNSLLKIIKMAIAQKKIVAERARKAGLLKSDLLDKYYYYKDLIDNNKIKSYKRIWKILTHDDYLLSESTYFWQIFINTVHQSLYKDGLLKYVNETEYLVLLSNIEDISHLRPFYKMWEISREIRKNDEKRLFWDTKSVDDILVLIDKNEDKSCIKEVRELINDFGYHSDKELDVSYPCYYEDASTLISSIKDMISLSDEFSPEKDLADGKKQYKEILDNIRKKVNWNVYGKLCHKIEDMRNMLWWREEFRDVSTRFYYLIRAYTLNFANELKKENIIDNSNDIWFLKVGNLWDYLDGKLSKEDLKEIIRKNKKYYYAFKNYMSENEIGEVFSEAMLKSQDDAIKGLGANNGVAEGTARVINDFNEISKLKENDILVTKYTDTGWTPKFAILSGIVTEYGGILCHAAIVSREYNIPAIVSCSGAMSKIKDGQKIRIDGSSGIVSILD